MGDQLKELSTRKNLISLLSLAVLVLAIPLGIGLVKQQQILTGQAAGSAVTFVAPNVETRLGPDGSPVAVALESTVGVQLKPPEGWTIENVNSTPEPSATPVAANISITSPTNNSSVKKGKKTDITVMMVNVPNVARVELHVNGKKETESKKSPFKMTWKPSLDKKVSSSSATLTARALDEDRNVLSISQPIQVEINK